MTDPARAFAAKVLRARQSNMHMDQFQLQDAFEESGLFVRVVMQEPCGKHCQCVEWLYRDEFPVDCLRLTDAAKALLAEYPE